MLREHEALSALRALHLPSNGAPGLGDLFSAIALGMIAALVIGELLAFMRKKRRTIRRSALDALVASRVLQPEDRLVAQAKLLRELIRALDGDATARLRGSAWLQHLDARFRTDFFTVGEGRHYADALYRPVPRPDLDAMDSRLQSFANAVGR